MFDSFLSGGLLTSCKIFDDDAASNLFLSFRCAFRNGFARDDFETVFPAQTHCFFSLHGTRLALQRLPPCPAGAFYNCCWVLLFWPVLVSLHRCK